jgi:hypothetical protein
MPFPVALERRIGKHGISDETDHDGALKPGIRGWFLAAPARADEVKAVISSLARPGPRDTRGAKVGGYLTIENKGSTPETGGSADVGDKVRVNEMSMNNGVMTMRPVVEIW